MADTAKDEIGDYSIATRFGGKQKIYHDKKWKRPVNRTELLHQLEATRLSNRWSWDEFGDNCRMLGLAVKKLDEYTTDELEIIRADFEQCRMILYEE